MVKDEVEKSGSDKFQDSKSLNVAKDTLLKTFESELKFDDVKKEPIKPAQVEVIKLLIIITFPNILIIFV